MRALVPAILLAALVGGLRQVDPLRLDRLATDDELLFEAPGVAAPDPSPPQFLY